MDDQKILELLRTNKRDKAILQLYHYFPKVEKLILSKGGNKEDAQDIYQEALIVFCRKARSIEFQLTASIGTYLYSVSRFLWKDELKKRKSSVSLDDDTNQVIQEEDGITEAIEQESKFKLAEKALSSIGQRCLNILQLFYLESVKMKAIATKMGFSSEKVAKNQKYKCLERAKLKLKELRQEPAIN